MATRLHRLLALAETRAAVDTLEVALAREAGDVDGVVVVGNLTEVWSKPATYREIFKALGASGLPSFWVPGFDDAPLHDYLSAAHAMEIAFPSLRGVHGTVALAPGNVLVAGMGGEVLDPPDTMRAEEHLVRYPGWEVEYRLKVIREFDVPERVFLFSTPPAHKGLGLPGSDVLAELVNTYRPSVVIVGGDSPAQSVLGRSLLVAPGRLADGHYAVVDLRERSADLRRFEVAQAAG
jgi:Icc-related predicted phosphoesterase